MTWARGSAPSWDAAWNDCPRGDWLLGIAARAKVDRRPLVRAACLCAREALDYVPEEETRPRDAIEKAEGWATGTVDAAARRESAEALEALCDAPPDPAVGAAALAALAACRTADDISEAATAAAAAAQAAVLDAGDCAMMEALRFMQRRCADHVRSVVTAEDLRSALERPSGLVV